MNKTVFFILIFITTMQTEVFSQKNRDSNRQGRDTFTFDSLEYELIILDPGFNAWFATQPPRDFYSNEYYASRNRMYVSEWNERYLRHSRLYENYVDYNPSVDYNIDLNYRLYYYFRYFEEKNKVKLIQGSR